jgi:cytochrome c556
MKRGLADERTFKRRAKETAGYVATLAAYGQVWRMMAPKDDASGKWVEYSDDQRDAAGLLNAAIHKQDWSASREALRKLTQSCNACHDLYRKSQ